MSSISFSEFCSLYSVEENWISKGWRKLDVIDGKRMKSWKQLAHRLKRDGNGSIVTESGDWFTVALEVENQLCRVVQNRWWLCIRLEESYNH